MINRLGDFPTSPTLARPRQAPSDRQAPAAQGWRQIADPFEETIKKYPGAALASAFLIGVALAWWIKRM